MQGWDAAVATLFLFQLECLPGTKGLVLFCPKDSRGCLSGTWGGPQEGSFHKRKAPSGGGYVGGEKKISVPGFRKVRREAAGMEAVNTPSFRLPDESLSATV